MTATLRLVDGIVQAALVLREDRHVGADDRPKGGAPMERPSPSGHAVTNRPAGESFVGRLRELSFLRSELERARTGGGGAVLLLGGEGGIGKTRLAHALAAEAESKGMAVVWGRAWEGGGAPTFWPWIEALRGAVAEAGAEELGEDLGPHVAQLLPEIRSRLPEALEPSGYSGIDPEHARFLLFDALTRLLVAAARRKPLMVVLDDLHAADTPSLLLLEYVARHLDGARLLIVGTVRDAELRRRPEAVEILPRVARGGMRLTLRGLSEAEVAELVRASVAETVPDEVVREIHRVSGGTPLFVQELIRTLAAEGRLSSPRTKIGAPGAIPEGILEVIRQRLAPLPTYFHDVLSVAAVAGSEFDAGVLEAVCDRPREQILEILDEGIAEGIVEVETGGRAAGRFRFAHTLFREALYQSVPHSRRLGLHLQIGKTLEETRGRPPELHLAELAHHFLEGAALGGTEKAIDYTMRAAAHAADRLAYEEAIALYERVLGLPFPDERERAEALAGLAQSQHSLGRREEAVSSWDQALSIHERLRRAEVAESEGGVGAIRGTELRDALLREEGDYWTVGFEGKTFHLRGVKGLWYLRELLRNPGREISVADLAGGAPPALAAQAYDDPALGVRSTASALGDAGEILDARGKREYAERLRDLRAELEEATRFNDLGRANRITAEIDALTREVTAATGLGGRDRKAASAAERARVNVTRTLADAVRKIAAKSPELGEYFSRTIKTGGFCSYNPDPKTGVSWRF